MKVTAVTPVAAAANPSHPDHARWVKEQTLAIETRNAQAMGLSFRVAETENTRQLERLAARKRKKIAPKKVPRPIDSPEQLAKEGVTIRPAPEIKRGKVYPCKACCRGTWCRESIRCKRAMRLRVIARLARKQDLRAVSLQEEITAIMVAALRGRDYRDAIGRELPFSRLVGRDVDKAVTAGVEWVCDRSTSFMGQWR